MRLFGLEIIVRRWKPPQTPRCLTFVTMDGDVGSIPPGYKMVWIGGDNAGMELPPHITLQELAIPQGFCGTIGSDAGAPPLSVMDAWPVSAP